MKKLFKISLALILVTIIVLGFAMPLNMAGNWYQQFMPNLNNEPLSDIYFVDSLIGFAVTADGNPNDTNYILKTTNGGDNWIIKYRAYRDFYKVKFINETTGFVCGGFNTSSGTLLKTTNSGENWLELNTPGSIWYEDMSTLNQDTIWLVLGSSGGGGVFRTTNGGVNWESQLNLGSQNPEKIYMFDRNLGFVSKATGQILYRTSNGGMNWTTLSTAGAFLDMYFANSTTGWKSGAPGGPGFRKTTDGGLNWLDQTMPSGGSITYSQIENLHGLNKDTIWGVGPFLLTTLGFRGMICRTTNGGNNWLFQVPDTSAIAIGQYDFINFTNKNNGWAYRNSPTGVHTTTGGDPVWLTPITQTSTEVPKEYHLLQNYPNPFNPKTNIVYIIKSSKLINLIIYDITGKKITDLVNKKESAGTYQVDWHASGYSSGIYFYSLIADGVLIDTKKMILIK